MELIYNNIKLHCKLQLIGVNDRAEKDEIVKSVMNLKSAEIEEGYTMDVVTSRQVHTYLTNFVITSIHIHMPRLTFFFLKYIFILGLQDLLMDVRDKLLFEPEYAGNIRENIPPKSPLRIPWPWLPAALCLLQEVHYTFLLITILFRHCRKILVNGKLAQRNENFFFSPFILLLPPCLNEILVIFSVSQIVGKVLVCTFFG